MADIFLSYAREDRAIAERLSSAIEAAGKSVWWDRHIKGGAQFSKDIERELHAATHVLVLWSAASVESRWVRDEASHAADDDRLIGASIDGAPAPLGFGQFHTVDLQEWRKTGVALPPDLAEALEADAAAPVPASSAPEFKRPILIAATAIALALAGGAYVATEGLPGSEETRRAPATIAILPFSVAGDEERADLGPGLANALNNALVDLDGLAITSNSSTAILANQGLGPIEIGERLGVDHLIEGRITIENGNATVSLALLDAATARQVWTANETLEIRYLNTAINRVTRSLASALQTRLGVGQGKLVDISDVDPLAYEAYARGLESVLARTSDTMRKDAFLQLRRSIQIDPDFAPSHAALAYLLSVSHPSTLSLDLAAGKAMLDEAAARALELDPDNVMARVASAEATTIYGGDLFAARDSLEQIVKEHPDSAIAQYALAYAYLSLGDHEAAKRIMEQARRTDPISLHYEQALLIALEALGDYPAIRQIGMACERCDLSSAYWRNAVALHGTDEQVARDIPLIAQRMVSTPAQEEFIQLQTVAIKALRDKNAALLDQVPMDDLPLNAEVLAYVGSYEKALAMLDRIEIRWPTLVAIRMLDRPTMIWPEEVRADPRYHAFFSEPNVQDMLAARRKLGNSRNHPVFPVKPYEGD